MKITIQAYKAKHLFLVQTLQHKKKIVMLKRILKKNFITFTRNSENLKDLLVLNKILENNLEF